MTFEVAKKKFDGGTHIMAIMNATPDSFYSRSRLENDAVERAGRFIAQGAEILDIGGQSTRPSAAPVSAIEELCRILPCVEAVRASFPDIPISVDTFYAQVAEACFNAGADMVNDVSCLSDPDMARTVAEHGASALIMHNRRASDEKDIMTDKLLGLSRGIDELLKVGVEKNKILLDGGIGFNKSNDEDRELLAKYPQLMSMLPQYPFLLGVSRKSLFGGDVGGRLTATLDVTARAVKWGVMFVRVHDVEENRAVIAAYSE